MNQKNLPTIEGVLQRLVLLRLFLPLVVLSVIAIGGVGYLGLQTLKTRQHQMVQSVAQMVNRYLDEAARALDAVGRVAEVSSPENVTTFMQGTWKAYGYFDTLYYLDVKSKIRQLMPPDPRYRGLDMSNLPYFQLTGEKKDLIISRPFISLRTGNPTVYLVRQLSRGGQMVGELNLGSLQNEIARGKGVSHDLTFILDQSGMLLAHPSFHLVKEQTNRSNLEIFRRGLGGEATLVYTYAGTMVLGSAAQVQRAGWVVVAQVPLSVSLGPYAWALGLTLFVSLVIWLLLAWSLRRRLEQQVALPLTQLSQGTGALANGDFNRGRALASLPLTFAELTALTADFQHMSDALEARQAALQESEEQYRSLFERLPVALFRTTPSGQHLDVNLAYVRMLGYSDREALLKVNAVELYLKPEERERWRAIVDQEGIVRDFERQVRRSDGTVIWVRSTSRVVRDNEGQVLYYEGSLEDITEHKRAEAEVVRLKNYLSNIVNSMPSVLVGMDCHQVVTQWNHQAEEVSGISATEAIGKTITRIFPDFSPWIMAMRNEIEQHRPAIVEKLLIEKEGERRFYDLLLYPLITNGVEGSVLRIEDVTERTRIQELMIQTEKMISLGGLAAGMAHEINNPLGIITQAAQNIERRVSPELPANRKVADDLGLNLEGMKAYFVHRQIPVFINNIREAAFRASRIIANMLQFGRQADSTIQPGLLSLIIEQALELAGSDYDLKKKYDFRHIEIIRDFEEVPEVPMVMVEMEQVLLNLFKNAAQAMSTNPPERKPRITLRLRREDRYLLLEVEDNGPGMTEEVRRRVFEPFFTTKEPGIGTGLGLSVSYMIVTQNHKGLMEVKSTPGRGTSFQVRLPLAKENGYD